MPSGVRSAFLLVAEAIVGLLAMWFVSTLPVSPETRLMAPGADGPNVVP